ncbi:hypothetical protein [Streptomyces cyaneofuscatus]|uniref:Uncharacterized protein n=1 Tax=Streptomyces cyaneofuscatus TaxID=66883 RepID=A0ABZ1ETG5_9ACTN|nr:hypothetical protein [Streptomyces cyaneofuscatus]WSB07350.1 hypothetical protein OG849_08840 [Streptomyces cyaneofuscatus]
MNAASAAAAIPAATSDHWVPCGSPVSTRTSAWTLARAAATCDCRDASSAMPS